MSWKNCHLFLEELIRKNAYTEIVKKQIIAFLIINLIFLAFGFNVKQQNPEELFLSDQSKTALQRYEKEFGSDNLTFVANSTPKAYLSMQEQIEKLGGEFVDLTTMMPGQAVFRLPPMDDEVRFNFLNQLSDQNKELAFAGMDYTNAHLAGMSIKIQKVLFPLIFAIMFLGLFFLLKNFTITVYLFLTSFVGVSVGLATLKLCFGYSSILTSLTPLVSFVLTLASQLHVVFGMQEYKKKKDFLHYKLVPILIMMVTTVIGFAGLIFSDLESIRQFGLSTTITLIVTWALNLLFLSNFQMNFHLPDFKFAHSLKRPNYRPGLGLTLALFLLGSGLYSLNHMPILVEALYFFPESHVVRSGQKTIEKNLGGIPQIDLMITKTDQTEISYEDSLVLAQYEDRLVKAGIPLKILSINQMVRKANEIYAGSATLPSDKNAYLVIKSRIPGLLRTGMQSEKAYKISFLATPMEHQKREEVIAQIQKELIHLPAQFKVELTGLNHLLLESQSYLVKTLVKSLMGSFLVIALLFAIFSRNLKEIFLFALISLSSIFGGLFLMKLFGFSLNVSSIMTLSISIGLVDDSTIHLLYAQKHGESETTIRRSCLIPMMLSHFVLLVSFLLLGFESFVPIRQFSLGLVMMLTMGLLLDLFVLPMLTKTKA